MHDNSTLLKNLGLGLQVLRLMKGVSQAELARECSIRPNQISRYETGQVLPQLGQLRRILDALKIDFVEYFIAVRLLSWIEELMDAPERGGDLAESALHAFLDSETQKFEGLRQAMTKAFREGSAKEV